MEKESGAQFEAEVAIGKGLRTIDRHGSASIDHGHLTLRDSKGDVVAEAPVSEVRGDKARFSDGSAARICIDGVWYSIGPLRVSLYSPGGLGRDAANLARSISRLKKGRELTEQFLLVLEAEGGQLGKPS
jgi:hypothetical protein